MSVLNVPIFVDGTHWGVLEVDTVKKTTFAEFEVHSLAIFANILGVSLAKDAARICNWSTHEVTGEHYGYHLDNHHRLLGRAHREVDSSWPAPGSEDTELGVLMELEVGHGETEVYARVQA